MPLVLIPQSASLHCPSEKNPIVHAFGEEVVFHLTGEQNGGAFSRWGETTPPGAGPPRWRRYRIAKRIPHGASGAGPNRQNPLPE